jgi:DNA-binding transcriptional regulator YhcF (GntR family)
MTLYNKKQLAEMHKVSVETINKCLKREELKQFLKNEKKQTIFLAEGIDLLKETIEEMKRSKIKEYIRGQREEELIKRGLYEKVPVIKEYYEDGDLLHKEVIDEIPYEVTEEEFEQIIRTPSIERKSTYGYYQAVGVVILIVGVIGGIFLGEEYDYSIATIAWASTILSSISYFAISNIISLLEDIKNK